MNDLAKPLMVLTLEMSIKEIDWELENTSMKWILGEDRWEDHSKNLKVIRDFYQKRLDEIS